MKLNRLTIRFAGYFTGALLISALTIKVFLQHPPGIPGTLVVLHVNAFGRDTWVIAMLAALFSSLELLLTGGRAAIKNRVWHFWLGILVALLVLFVYLLVAGYWWPAVVAQKNILNDYLFVLSSFGILFLPLAGTWGILVGEMEKRLTG